MSNEIRRRRTDSPEIDAMIVIEQAFQALNFEEGKRVLTWAEERYIGGIMEARRLRLNEFNEGFTDLMGGFSTFIEHVQQAAKRVTGLSPQRIFEACEVIADEAERIEKAKALEVSTS